MSRQVCIVEQPQDILALEHTGVYKGLYHVLHGAISPTEGIGADDIRTRELLARLQNNTVKEVILATNTNLEGEQTAMYLSRLITPLGIKVTRLPAACPSAPSWSTPTMLPSPARWREGRSIKGGRGV